MPPSRPALAAKQAARRKELWGLLGGLPPRRRPITCRKVAEESHPAYVLEKLILDLNGLEDVPALFIRPHALKRPAPALLYHHWHGGQYDLGKTQFLQGSPAMQAPPYAEEAARLGWCGLCIDTWLFGERRGRTESEVFKEMLWNGRVLWGMMIYDAVRSLDYLVSRPEVDASRIATLGMSMGSTLSWWLAALDTRVKACVDICCLTDFHALIDARGLDGHGIYYYVPSLLKHFTTAQINALIAPRPHLSLAGDYDKLTPPAGLDRIDAELRREYARLGAPQAWRLLRCKAGHVETALMRAEILAFLRKWV